MTQKERLEKAYEYAHSVWAEMLDEVVSADCGQIAVDLQVEVNRIVWKINKQRNREYDKR